MTKEETKPGADDELIERQIQEYEAYKQRSFKKFHSYFFVILFNFFL